MNTGKAKSRKYRKSDRAQRAFIERGLASAARAKKTGKYVTAEAVLRELTRQLQSARSR